MTSYQLEWKDRALVALRVFLAIGGRANRRFTAPDARAWIESRDLIERPYSERAWGGVFRRAFHQGLIAENGFTTHRGGRMHTQTVRLWKKAT